MTLGQDYHFVVHKNASQTFDFRKLTSDHNKDDSEESHIVLRDRATSRIRAWVIPNVLSSAECHEMMQESEGYGLEVPDPSLVLRTAKRTKDYTNAEWSRTIASRVRSGLENRLSLAFSHEGDMREGVDGMGPFHGLHPNWRVVRYDVGDVFPVHQDQMDTYQVKNERDGTKDLVMSSHTLLIQLTEDGTVDGGATRFYPACRPFRTGPSSMKLGRSNAHVNANAEPAENPYGEAVDVFLPQGWGLVFEQNGLMHAGQPVLRGSKYVAQAGVMRFLPKGKLIRPSVFKYGPGVQEHLETAAQELREKQRRWQERSEVTDTTTGVGA